ncbi:MAG: hydroxymethylglutaryl-CoA reductase, degradative, partial [Pseudomonadota bacterium]
DVRDAMGANAVNTMAERLAPHVERWTGGTVGLRILSNLADRRLVRARAVWPAAEIGAEVVEGMLDAYAFAAADPYRAATHNKGIMNGVSAVALATGNDTRALEAGAHAYAATRPGGYGPLTRWEKTAAGDLTGVFEAPIPVGIVGGATKAHPTARIALEIMGADTADRLARIMAAVGLVQNFSAMRALATEGIQRGHMALHARNVALAAGATGEEIDRVAAAMIEAGEVGEAAARRLLDG